MWSLALSVSIFYILHSLLAATAVKHRGERMLGGARRYRLFYTLLSVLLTGVIIWRHQMASPGPCVDLPAPARTAGFVLAVAGALLSTFAVLALDGAGFLGLRAERDTGLVRKGLHGHVRHPIYTGIVLIAIGGSLVAPCSRTAVVVGLTLIYVPMGIRLEEAKLIQRFADAYRTYRREVPALVPRWRRNE